MSAEGAGLIMASHTLSALSYCTLPLHQGAILQNTLCTAAVTAAMYRYVLVIYINLT